MYQNPANNNILAGGGGAGGGVTSNNPNAQIMDPIQQQQQQQQQNINYNGMQPQQQQPSNNNKNVRKKPYVKITEQPAGKALRFRYECEGRSAGSIPGVNSTPENKTYPTIEIVGYKGRAVVVVSCVTKDQPYRPHPHNLVGKEGCKKGVCTLEINSETMRAVFSNLGIQCVKKKDIEAALKAREEIRVDPFKTGFAHRFQPSSIDLNSVRLCFQVFMESDQKGRFTQPLPPVVSEPIYDKKAMSDLVICRLCSCSATVLGNTQIILLCEKVAKEDISVRFYEENNGKTIWEAYGEFQHTDVHKQTAIAFKTPRYRKIEITEPAKVFIQLKRPSDGVTSEPLPFEYVPLDSGRKRFLDLRRNLKRKPDLDIFQEILASEIKEQEPISNEKMEVIDLNTPTAEELPASQSQQSQGDTVLTPTSTDTTNVDDEEAKRRSQQEIDTIIDEKMRELEQQQHLQTPQDQCDSLQEVVELLNAGQQHPQEGNQQSVMDTNEKITEWMNSNEMQELENPTINESMETNTTSSTTTGTTQVAANDSDDKTLSDLLEQVAELDDIYSDHVIRRDTYNSTLINELNGMDSCVPATDGTLVDGGQTAMEVEESFDDAATYSSLQIAFKNPISIPMEDIMPPTPPASNLQADFENDHYDPIEVRSSPASATSSPPAPVVNIQKPDILAQSQPQLQTPPRPAPPKINSPHMHVTAAEEEKLPPLPPKRLRKQDSNAENRSIEANIGGTLDRKSRQQTPIIIMKTPDQSPPTKRLPQKPGAGNSSTLPKQKKPGFFSKLFSRRKSKSDLSQAGDQTAGSKAGSKAASPTVSREPSIGHFNLNDSNRASMRSIKSLQPISLPNSPEKKVQKVGKPVGRSVSSVSGKRPAHLNANVIHIPLKGDSVSSLPHQEEYSHASTLTLSNTLDRKTVSALQLADIPICDGNMELVAITDRQSLRNLCEGEFNVQLDPNVDLTEAEHFALYTSIPPQATVSEFDETSAYYAPVDAGEILTPEEVAERLVAANRIN
ncbi:Embryonic polarity protein dorsal [Lucilia cuprina]|nr:Embryonic polarity protein dorsal [Lucilia cuprina]KAI8126535.1 Embryonic polarity protein dorsal [Lucilia cuprina]